MTEGNHNSLSRNKNKAQTQLSTTEVPSEQAPGKAVQPFARAGAGGRLPSAGLSPELWGKPRCSHVSFLVSSGRVLCGPFLGWSRPCEAPKQTHGNGRFGQAGRQKARYLLMAVLFLNAFFRENIAGGRFVSS